MKEALEHKKEYDDWHKQLHVDMELKTYWHKKVVRLSSPEQDFSQKRVLEIGCGRGGFACWLATQVHTPKEVVACDFSTTAVQMGQRYSKENNINNITWKEADIMNIPFPDNSFDTVISCETIEHVHDPAKAVKELARVLRPGGRLFLTTPNYFNFFGIYRGYRAIIGRPFQEAGQPINKFVMLPVTLRWLKRTGIKVETYGSEDILIPRLRRPPYHLSIPPFFAPVSKWLGIQSFLLGRKP